MLTSFRGVVSPASGLLLFVGVACGGSGIASTSTSTSGGSAGSSSGTSEMGSSGSSSSSGTSYASTGGASSAGTSGGSSSKNSSGTGSGSGGSSGCGDSEVLDGLEISVGLQLSASSVSIGQTLTGTATLFNPTSAAIKLEAADIAGRPPGGTNLGGPFLDLLDGPGVTIDAGKSFVLTGSRQFTASDPLGSWYAYVTIEDSTGVYHDSQCDAHFTVVAAGTGTTSSSSSGSSTSSSGRSSSSGSSSSGSGAAALLSYLEGLPTGTSNRLLSGQHSNYWDSNQLDQFTGTLPNVTIGTTGLTPAILGTTFSASDIPNFGLDGSAEDGVTLTNAWLAAGGIVQLSLWPGNPQTMDGNQGDLNLSASELLTQGSASYNNWQTYLAALAAKLQQLDGPILLRPLIEINGNWFWWGTENFSAAQFIQLWQQMHDYIVGQGVTNVLWVYNVNAGEGNYTAYYPGANYVDIVSLDSYPPTSGDVSTYSALQTLGKPIIYSEVGVEEAVPEPATFSGDNSALLATIETNCPGVAAVIVWCQNWALSEQNGAAGFMGDPWIINSTGVPAGL
jgi:mannan endo-1,4-beta-mannosidase